MNKYGRILKNYNRRILYESSENKKIWLLWKMVRMSYDVACEPEPWQLMHLSQLISKERNPELREALEALDEFMNGY